MKIKLSKAQWQYIGTKTGWIEKNPHSLFANHERKNMPIKKANNENIVFDASINSTVDLSNATTQQLKELMEVGEFSNQDYQKIKNALNQQNTTANTKNKTLVKIAITSEQAKCLEYVFSHLDGVRNKADRIWMNSVEQEFESLYGAAWIQVFYDEYYENQGAFKVQIYFDKEYIDEQYQKTVPVIPNCENPQETVDKIKAIIQQMKK